MARRLLLRVAETSSGLQAAQARWVLRSLGALRKRSWSAGLSAASQAVGEESGHLGLALPAAAELQLMRGLSSSHGRAAAAAMEDRAMRRRRMDHKEQSREGVAGGSRLVVGDGSSRSGEVVTQDELQAWREDADKAAVKDVIGLLRAWAASGLALRSRAAAAAAAESRSIRALEADDDDEEFERVPSKKAIPAEAGDSGRCEAAVAVEEALTGLENQAVVLAHMMSGSDAAWVVISLVRMGRRPMEPLATEMATQILLRRHEVYPTVAVRLLKAYALIGERPDGLLLSALMQRIADGISGLGPSEVSSTFWSLALLSLRPDPTSLATARSRPAPSAFLPPRNDIDAIWTRAGPAPRLLARLASRVEDLAEAGCGAAVGKSQDASIMGLEGGQAARVLWAAGHLGMQPSEGLLWALTERVELAATAAVRAVAEAGSRDSHTASKGGSVAAVHANAVGGDELSERALNGVAHDLNKREAADALWGLAALGVRGKRARLVPVLAALVASNGGSDLTGESLVEATWALACLAPERFSPQDGIGGMDLNGSGCSQYGASELEIATCLAKRAEEMLPKLGQQEAEALSWAVGVLRWDEIVPGLQQALNGASNGGESVAQEAA